jgi:hypothetical protein
MAVADVILCTPSKYLSGSEEPQFTSPPLDWFCRTWAVTHSTLSMWRSAKNVRITYKDLGGGSVDDLVEYEKRTKLKNVHGVDKTLGPGSWIWRGKGFLKPFTSHWEVLGWGEHQIAPDGKTERWIVTWFAKTLFTEEGVDILTDQQDGLSQETLTAIMTKLATLEDAKDVVDMVEKNMKPVEIKLPWQLADS